MCDALLSTSPGDTIEVDGTPYTSSATVDDFGTRFTSEVKLPEESTGQSPPSSETAPTNVAPTSTSEGTPATETSGE